MTTPSKTTRYLDSETWGALRASGFSEAELEAEQPCGPMIYSYTRAQAIEDGVLVDLCQHPTPEDPELDDLRQLVLEAGFKVHAAMTATAFAEAVCSIGADLPAGQSIEGRLWDVLFVLRMAIRAHRNTDRVHFQVSVYDGPRKRRTVRLWSLIGPGDDGEPVLTIMLEGED